MLESSRCRTLGLYDIWHRWEEIYIEDLKELLYMHKDEHLVEGMTYFTLLFGVPVGIGINKIREKTVNVDIIVLTRKLSKMIHPILHSLSVKERLADKEPVQMLGTLKFIFKRGMEIGREYGTIPCFDNICYTCLLREDCTKPIRNTMCETYCVDLKRLW